MRLLAIDPGKTSGWAKFINMRLTSCGVFTPWDYDADELVIEIPRIYPASLGKGDPNDLIPVAIDAGRHIERFTAAGGQKIRQAFPFQWKGQVKKEIHHPRIQAALSDLERDVLKEMGKEVVLSRRHNMFDAVGLGLWALGRMVR